MTNRLLKSFGLTIAVLLLATHRCPAPIEEVQQTPTPTATIAPTVASAHQSIATPTPVAAVPRTTGAERFAGTWIGKINIEKVGEVEVTLVINADGTSVQHGSKLGRADQPLTYNGKMVSWQAGAKHNIPWTLSLNPDGRTAFVTRTIFGKTSTAIFKRADDGQNATSSPSQKKGRRR